MFIFTILSSSNALTVLLHFNKVSCSMGRDDSWPTTVLSVVPSYSCANSILIGPSQSGFPMSWFFPTARTTRVFLNSTHPQTPPFSFFCSNCPKWRNHTSDCKSNGGFWIRKPKFLFVFCSYRTSILFRFGDIHMTDRQTDGQTVQTITIAGPHIVAGQLIAIIQKMKTTVCYSLITWITTAQTDAIPVLLFAIMQYHTVVANNLWNST